MASRTQHEFREEIVHPTEREPKVVIIDADSLTFMCSYRPNVDENGNPQEPYGIEDYPIIESCIDETLLKIYNAIEEHYDIAAVYICVKGRNNIRKKWMEKYKHHRPEIPETVTHLHNYLISKHNAIPAEIGEADDLVYTLSKDINHQGIIVCIDKDLYQIPSLFLNYKTYEWKKVSEAEAIYNLHFQWVIGDSGDFKGLSPGIGKAYAEKHLDINFTDEQYKEAVWNAYMKAWKNDEILAKNNMDLCYKLVKLHTIEELKEYENKEKAN